MSFAVGKHSEAICDRCGYQYPYLDLRKEWNGLLTCPECYEPKHPQLDPPYHAPDPEALKNPRPDRVEPIVVPVGYPNETPFSSVGMQPSPIRKDLVMRMSIGNVTVSTS